MLKKIAITLGEPAGIGAELVQQLATKQQLNDCIIIGDKNLLPKLPTSVECQHMAVEQTVQLGKLNPSNAQYVLKLLDTATSGCIQGKYSAMLTCPLHKGIINASGVKFTGHTEYLAEISNSKKVVMMLLNQHMRVALATTHLPLKEVAANITTKNLSSVLNILIQDMQTKFAIKNPKIGVCGLNPHAGEDGHLGMEEIDIINPVIKQFQTQGHQVFGAIPADTLFTSEKLKDYDAVLAMYHDQGLAPLKYAGFGKSVNITLGLPFIRTSVDHGTALDIAGQNLANADSFMTALTLTRWLVNNAN
ncbi:MAG: 4-hydroxythreonine-4-phosphate dehydrogenase PdxA [Proteobacteria bacterium]|nr:4-hydroxythreonine-4-phosphate dehydrogenase PdxA [Pseudomonadota bacterium]